jgi:hypothetical protein
MKNLEYGAVELSFSAGNNAYHQLPWYEYTFPLVGVECRLGWDG